MYGSTIHRRLSVLVCDTSKVYTHASMIEMVLCFVTVTINVVGSCWCMRVNRMDDVQMELADRGGSQVGWRGLTGIYSTVHVHI